MCVSREVRCGMRWMRVCLLRKGGSGGVTSLVMFAPRVLFLYVLCLLPYTYRLRTAYAMALFDSPPPGLADGPAVMLKFDDYDEDNSSPVGKQALS
jgi:hypothetical protein